MGISQTMPTRAPWPPASLLKSTAVTTPPPASPPNRATATVRAIKAAILTSSFALGPDDPTFHALSPGTTPTSAERVIPKSNVLNLIPSLVDA